MKRKILMIILTISILFLFAFGIYKLIAFLDYKSSLSSLEKYTFFKEEKVLKTFTYDKYTYLLTKYYDTTSSWSHLHLLLKDNKEYYLLKNIRKCDTLDEGNNLYIKENELYIHCIGSYGNIDKYSIDDLDVKKEVFRLNYKNTPNISQLHIEIEKVDKEYIYLSSPFKVDNSLKEEPKVKCSLKKKICSYN